MFAAAVVILTILTRGWDLDTKGKAGLGWGLGQDIHGKRGEGRAHQSLRQVRS